MIVNKCYERIIVGLLSTMLTEKGLDKNMKIKHVLTGNRVLEGSKLKNNVDARGTEPTPSAAPI